MSINFKPESIYSEGSQYYKHGRQFQAFGKGISFYFQHQLMKVLSEYKYAVARNGYSINKDLSEFESILCLRKVNGDLMDIYAYNILDTEGNSGSVYPYYFYSTIDMKIANIIYKTDCGNSNTLEEMKFFYVKDLVGLDGKRTGAYYFCEFYNLHNLSNE
jgi:hypothetical protein